MKKIIKLSKSCIGNEEKQSVMIVLDREYLGMGIEVQKFENDLSNFFGREVVCVVNGTAALHLSLQASNLTFGDEVLLPSLTYIASYQAVSASGATPIACDIDPNTMLLDINDLKKRLTNNTKAIMPVHYSGGVDGIYELYDFAKENNLIVIEDAAHAFGTKYMGKRIGSFGQITCFSFDGIKNITSGEGGCVVTDNNDIINKIKDARLLGVQKDTEKRYLRQRSWDFNVLEQGWRYHMSDIMAAIGIEQLKKFPKYANKRQKLAKYYDKLFKPHSKIKSLERDYTNVVPHIYVIRINGLQNRELIQKKMLDKGIEVGYHYQPNHLLTKYKKNNHFKLPITESIFPELITLPLHPDLTELDVKYIVDNLNNIVKSGA